MPTRLPWLSTAGPPLSPWQVSLLGALVPAQNLMLVWKLPKIPQSEGWRTGMMTELRVLESSPPALVRPQPEAVTGEPTEGVWAMSMAFTSLLKVKGEESSIRAMSLSGSLEVEA